MITTTTEKTDEGNAPRNLGGTLQETLERLEAAQIAVLKASEGIFAQHTVANLFEQKSLQKLRDEARRLVDVSIKVARIRSRIGKINRDVHRRWESA
jgi:hypothetical protein